MQYSTITKESAMKKPIHFQTGVEGRSFTACNPQITLNWTRRNGRVVPYLPIRLTQDTHTVTCAACREALAAARTQGPKVTIHSTAVRCIGKNVPGYVATQDDFDVTCVSCRHELSDPINGRPRP